MNVENIISKIEKIQEELENLKNEISNIKNETNNISVIDNIDNSVAVEYIMMLALNGKL